MKSKVAKKLDIPRGKVKVVEIENNRIALCNVRDSYYAIEDICTHDGGALDQGELIDDIIECPRHGAQFRVTDGAVLRMPAVIPLRTYPVTVDGDDIYVEVSD